MKNKMNITKKLFIINILVFAIFIGTTLIVQSVFFEKFYVSKKKSDLGYNIKKFKQSYNKSESLIKAAELIEEYEETDNITIVVTDSLNRIKLITKTPKNRFTVIKTKELKEFVGQWSNNPSNIISLKTNDKTIITTTKKRDASAGSLVAISNNTQRDEIIYALSSLQPVSEAVSVIKQLYLYFSLGAIFFMIALSFIYSNMISKPLLKINKVANKMAQLDFSEKCVVNSEDEIGGVATSLNFLSENLNASLNSLREANAKLGEDIIKERNLEKMRREFVDSVSHELKTPVSIIDGYAVGLKDNIFEDKDRDFYLDIIIDETRKMGNLVSDMLKLSHLESGSFKLKRENFNITELIYFTLKNNSGILNNNKVNIQLNLIEGVKINADWVRMDQVFTNFFTNALTYVNEFGTIYISIVDKGDRFSVEVENTGSSIPEDELDKVWDKFYRVEKSRNKKLGGTGIGLSIVKNILMLHDYPFGVENTDKGIKFYFVIPKDDDFKI